MRLIRKKFINLLKQLQQNIKLWTYLGAVLWKSSKYLSILLFVLSLLGGLTLAAELWAMTTFINQLIELDITKSRFGQTLLSLLPFMLIFIGAMFIKNITSSIQPYISRRLEEEAASFLKDQIFKKSLSLDLKTFETKDFYDQLNYSNSAIANQLWITLESLTFFLTGIFQLSVIIVAIAKVGIPYALLLFIGSIILIVLNIQTSKRLVDVNYEQSTVKRHAQYWANLSTSRETAGELRLFGLGPYFLKKWRSLSEQLLKEYFDIRKKLAYLKIKGELLLIILIGMIISVTVYSGIAGTISVGALVAFLYMISQFEETISGLSGHGEMLFNFHYSFKHVPKFLQFKGEERDSGIEAPTTIKSGITFENVSFTYPGSTNPALKNVSFHMKPGEKLAIVGQNGAGKSTLALLFLGLYEPTSGRILVDGIDLKSIHPTSWRKKVSAVFQDFMTYQLSARDNIIFGDIHKQDREELFKNSAALSGIDGVLSSLPNGYDTILGREYEDSKDLSGGEKQKIAIARAYYKNADFLVLDEPAAALDAESEYELYRQFSQVSEGKTTMLISHRLGSAKLADRVIFLRAGQLTEIGSHQELINKNGVYAHMYHMQAAWYQTGGEKNGKTT